MKASAVPTGSCWWRFSARLWLSVVMIGAHHGVGLLWEDAAGSGTLVAAEPSAPATSRVSQASDVGPAGGSLVIVGGGGLPAVIVDEFIRRAGGLEAQFVIIPTAHEGETWDETYLQRSFLARRGAKSIQVLHTRDRAVADSDDFLKPLETAGGVWIDGGRQWRLADAYLGTRTVDALHAVLQRGGVIGGSSAGATIQGDYLVRGAPEGNHIMMAPGHEAGFGFLKNAAIDQHIVPRRRHLDLDPVIRRHPRLLGIGIDEATAIVVTGNRFRVIGNGVVLVHNITEATDDPDLPYRTLQPGVEFDLRDRRVLSAGNPAASPTTR